MKSTLSLQAPGEAISLDRYRFYEIAEPAPSGAWGSPRNDI